MKNLTNFILTLILGFVLSLFFPWWAIMLAAFLSGAIVRLRNAAVFFVPFLAIALLWIINAWMLSSANNYILAEKIAELLQLQGQVMLLILITGLIGGIAAGLAGIFGNQCRAILAKNE